MKQEPIMMVLNRNYSVSSTLGHVLTFKKGEPLPVPPIMVHECASIGAERVDGKDVFKEPEPVAPMPVDPSQRQLDIRKAIDGIVERNARDDFTAGGSPKVKAVSDEVGYKVDQSEVSRAWRVRAEELANDTE